MDLGRRRTATLAIVGMATVMFAKKRKRRVWVKEYRRRFGHLPLINELREHHPEDFNNYLRMSPSSYELLLQKVQPRIRKQDTHLRNSISADERLTATLRFLATGRSYEDLKFSTGISAPSLSQIIPETCKAIYEVLKEDYMKFPSSKEEWSKIASEFERKWHFVNCGGSMDGKHIRITPPPHSGAYYYNYKHFYSIVLLALVGPNYEFLYVDVGKNGRHSDGGVLEYTEFYRKLKSQQLHLPDNSETVNNLNFVFLGDEAFGLSANFLRPYAQRELDRNRRIFNYRLSRARNVVENAFGIISSRFRVLHTAMNIKPKSVCYVVLAICALHNYLRVSSESYVTPSVVDREDVNAGTVLRGDWHNSSVDLQNLETTTNRQVTQEAKQNRENYMNYFITDGKVDWQDAMIDKGIA